MVADGYLPDESWNSDGPSHHLLVLRVLGLCSRIEEAEGTVPLATRTRVPA